MQRLFPILKTTWYFAFGAPEKSSLSAQYCRQNHFIYLKDPSAQELNQHIEKDLIIEGCVDLFQSAEKIKPELNIIAFGKCLSDKEKQIRREYRNLLRCIDVPECEYSAFRKSMYPNIIFFYGPNEQQTRAASSTLSRQIGYQYSLLPQKANDFITSFRKTDNYAVNGLFTDPKQINILDNYFRIKIVHFIHKREDIPSKGEFFDKQYDLLPFLKDKNFYLPVKGDDHPITIMDNVGIGLCPKLIYVHYGQCINKKSYVYQYLEATDGVILDIEVIEKLLKRKKLTEIANSYQRTSKISEVLYRNLEIKQVLICGYPIQIEDFVSLENINRSFSKFIDLSDSSKLELSDIYTSQIYYLQKQKRITPSLDLPLADSLVESVDYWIVNGTGTCGKTTVAKYIAAEYGYKLIEFETQCAALKQKLANPDEGDEVPAKKFIAYFGKLIKSNPCTTYIFDSLPYEKGDLQEWVKVVGAPHVINLKVENVEQIKRGRKKAQGDVNAEIAEQDTAKANECAAKNTQWIENLGEISPSSKIYQVDYKLPQLLAEKLINPILRPRIFLVQKNNNLIYQKLAIKHDMAYISLRQTKLEDCISVVRKCDKRNIIICGYVQKGNEKLVSQDLYWIQKNLGDIRYLGIWSPEEKNCEDKKMHLERPPKEEKPKKAEGEEGQEQPPAQEGQGQEGGVKKKALDIYEFEWTHPSSHKNLSQWFCKLKTDITERNCSPSDCYNKFTEVLDLINGSQKTNVYETIQ